MTLRRAVLACICLTAAGCAEQGFVDPDGTARMAATAKRAASVFPDVIPLPTGFGPEGIASGRGTTIYVGSIPTGAIWRGDTRTGTGALLVPPQPGRQATGLKYDPRTNRLYVAGAFTGQAYVYDASTGATLATYQLGAPPGSFINDVIVTKDAAYFTESFAGPVLYRVPLGHHGALPPQSAVQTITLTGFQFVPGNFNANGIVATPNGKTLIVVNSATGTLYRVDPTTGQATPIDLGGASLPGGDGLLLAGHTLYVVQGGTLNRVSVVRLDPHFSSGTIESPITSASLHSPSTVAESNGSLYVVNAHFDQAPPPAPAPGVAFEVVRLPKR